MTDETLPAIRAIAAATPPSLPPCDPDHFGKCVRTMGILAKRADDEITGELRFAIYRRHFGHYPAEAISYLAERATLECVFFPAPVECQRILDDWKRNDPASRAKARAAEMLQARAQSLFEDAKERLRVGAMTQAQLDALPDQWKRILDCQGVIRFRNGKHVLRAQLVRLLESLAA